VTAPYPDDGPDREAETEAGLRRRRGLAAVRSAARSALVRRRAPWVVVALLALATCAAGVIAWSDATAWIPGPGMTTTEASVTARPTVLR